MASLSLDVNSITEMTNRGKAADLFDVLLVALGACWSPWGAPGIPESVVVLKRVLSCAWNHHLQKIKSSGIGVSLCKVVRWH